MLSISSAEQMVKPYSTRLDCLPQAYHSMSYSGLLPRECPPLPPLLLPLPPISLTPGLHQQADEFDFRVSSISVDLRDGVRLTRLVEVLTCNWGMSLVLRVPAVSRLQARELPPPPPLSLLSHPRKRGVSAESRASIPSSLYLVIPSVQPFNHLCSLPCILDLYLYLEPFLAFIVECFELCVCVSNA